MQYHYIPILKCILVERESVTDDEIETVGDRDGDGEGTRKESGKQVTSEECAAGDSARERASVM